MENHNFLQNGQNTLFQGFSSIIIGHNSILNFFRLVIYPMTYQMWNERIISAYIYKPQSKISKMNWILNETVAKTLM